MARRYEDARERDLRDRRSRPQEMSREQDSRDRTDSTSQLRIDALDSGNIEHPRDGYSDLRSTRDSATRGVYSYADEMDLDDVYRPSRGRMDDPRDRHRTPINAPPGGRGENPPSRYQEYFLPGEDINREVIQCDICRYLGSDARVQPYTHPDGRRGYLIKAYRALTTAMITTLKQDSKRFDAEEAQRHQQSGQPGMSFGSSATFDDRQRQGRSDVAESGYAGYGMDVSMDDYEDRGTTRGYRHQEPRVEPSVEPRMDPWQDTRQPLPSTRQGQTLALSQSHSQDPAYFTYYTSYPGPRVMRAAPQGYPPDASQGYPLGVSQRYPVDVSQGYPPGAYYPTHSSVETASSAFYDAAVSQPRSLEPNNTPPPPMGRGSQTMYAGAHTLPATATSGPERTSADVTTGRYPPYRPGTRHPGWGDTPNFQNHSAS